MSNALPYYPRYPRDLIEGTIGMSFEAKTSYSFLIDLIYMQGGQLPDDARYIAGMFNCSVRKWNSIKKELLSLGKITIKNGFIQNYRALIELEKLSKYRDKQAENGRAPNKNNNLEKPRLNQSKPDTNTESSSKSDDDFDLVCNSIIAKRFPNSTLQNPEVKTSWLIAGLDPEKQIYPELEKICANAKAQPISWNYFSKHILSLPGGSESGGDNCDALSDKMIIRNFEKIKSNGLTPPPEMQEQYDKLVNQQGDGLAALTANEMN